MAKVKAWLKNYKKLWQLLKACARFLNIILIPFYIVFIRFFVINHGKNKNKYILFFSGSTGEMLVMARLVDAFAKKYGATLVIASKQYTDIFRLLSSNPEVEYLWLTDVKIEKIRNAFDVSRIHEDKQLQPGVIRPVFLSLYRNLHELILADRLSARDAFTWILDLDKDTPYKYVSYSEHDKAIAVSILSEAEKDISKIALINPICYTHKNITVNGWKGVADALFSRGYQPVFNVKRNLNYKKRNANSENGYLVPTGFPIVEIPAYLVPICADLVGIGCSRHGGGFDLLYSFNKKNNGSLLISLSPKVVLTPFQKPDPPYSTIKDFYEKESGKELTYTVLLDSADDEQDVYKKVLDVLKPVNKS